MNANRFIRREYLEEIMLSLVTDTVEEEDLTEINELYEIYTSRVMNSLGKTQLYFKQFIITFCVLHRDALANKIHNEVERNNFIRNFGEQEKNNEKQEKNNEKHFFSIRWIILLYRIICIICPFLHPIIQFCVWVNQKIQFCIWVIIFIINLICVVYHFIKEKMNEFFIYKIKIY